jgi:hypothetical protein
LVQGAVYRENEDGSVYTGGLCKMEMSKIGPDAEWSVCWSTGYRTTAPLFKDFHPSRLKKDHFSQEETPQGDLFSDNDEEDTRELIFGALLLSSKVWWVKEGEDNKEECRVEVDGKLACKWREETAT